MTKVNLKLTAKKLFNDYMGIDISVAMFPDDTLTNGIELEENK